MKGLINVSEKTRVRLKIVGSEFVVSADEDKDYIVKISKMVDEQIKALLRQGESMNIAMAAILAALNYCDELEKEKIITEELLRRTEASESLASRLSAEVERLRVENKELRDEKTGLHKLIDELNGADGENEQHSKSAEEAPHQLSIPLTDNEPESNKEDEQKTDKESEQKAEAENTPAEQEEAIAQEQTTAQIKEEPVIMPQQENQEQPKPEVTEKAAPVKNEAAQQNQTPAPKAPPLTARQMLEEKRRALLAQQKANPKQTNRPKPFRPVSSEKSGGGSFSHGNAKPATRASGKPAADNGEFAEIPPEDEMISFFDRR